MKGSSLRLVAALGALAGSTGGVARADGERFVVLLLESNLSRELAGQFSEALLHEARARGIAARQIPVTMEEVLLSIECVEPTTVCYRNAANEIGADTIVFGRVELSAARLDIAVRSFDARTGTVQERARAHLDSPTPNASAATRLASQAVQALQARPESASTPWSSRVGRLTWISLGGAAVLLASASIFGALSVGAQAELDSMPSPDPTDAAAIRRLIDTADRGRTMATIANVGFILAGIVGAAAVTLAVTDLTASGAPEAPAATVTLLVQPDGVEARVVGRF